jgi:glycosidase
MPHWTSTAVVYHIYPLGLLDAPRQLDPTAAPVSRLKGLTAWTDHIRAIGCNTVYLGPVFTSASHGYDTIDYRQVDPRLGTNDDLRDLVRHWHESCIRVVLDGVFNHVGRDHAHFRNLLEHGETSAYRDWFADVDFSTPNARGDAFSYTGWDGHLDLVKLNLSNPAVREELFAIVRGWFHNFDIDGLRLDAADVIDKGFLRDLAGVCRSVRPDCWLFGEVVHGNYAEWIGPDMLDGVTNYEAFKGLYSSLNDHNLFEIAHSLNREFGPGGVYAGLQLYSFADNHDVNRVASLLKDIANLPLLYTMLFTMPGVPSIYYGSEWGIGGRKRGGDDGPLRPGIAWPLAESDMSMPELQGHITRLAGLRQQVPALQGTDYLQLHVANEQFAYLRGTVDAPAVVVINVADTSADLRFPLPLPDGLTLQDVLGTGESATVAGSHLSLSSLPPRSARVLVPSPQN